MNIFCLNYTFTRIIHLYKFIQLRLMLKVSSFIIRNSFFFTREYNIFNTFYWMQTIAQTPVTTIGRRMSILNWTSLSCLCMLGIFFTLRLSKLFYYFFYTIDQIIMSLGSVCDSSSFFFLYTFIFINHRMFLFYKFIWQ